MWAAPSDDVDAPLFIILKKYNKMAVLYGVAKLNEKKCDQNQVLFAVTI